jgi:ABC-type tungstate transport system substrate-binding protein
MTSNGPITRDHIESRFRAIQSEVEGVESEARSYTTIAVVAVTVTVVVLAFALGSRRGRKRRTLVEIRRA